MELSVIPIKNIVLYILYHTCIKGLSCLDALRASISWSMFLMRPGVRVTVEMAGDGGLVEGKLR